MNTLYRLQSVFCYVKWLYLIPFFLINITQNYLTYSHSSTCFKQLLSSARVIVAVTPCLFILILVTFIYYRYYTHLFIYILYIYFLFLSFFPFGPPSTHWVVPRALFIKLVKRSYPVPVTDTLSWVSFSLAVGALYKLYYYYYYYYYCISFVL